MIMTAIINDSIFDISYNIPMNQQKESDIKRIHQKLITMRKRLPEDLFGVIYALKDQNNRIVYVGQAKDKLSGFNRISAHLRDKTFSSWAMVRVLKCKLDSVERELIYNLQPIYNEAHKQNTDEIERVIEGIIYTMSGKFTISTIHEMIKNRWDKTQVSGAFYKVRSRLPRIKSERKGNALVYSLR